MRLETGKERVLGACVSCVCVCVCHEHKWVRAGAAANQMIESVCTAVRDGGGLFVGQAPLGDLMSALGIFAAVILKLVRGPVKDSCSVRVLTCSPLHFFVCLFVFLPLRSHGRGQSSYPKSRLIGNPPSSGHTSTSLSESLCRVYLLLGHTPSLIAFEILKT